MVDRQLRWLGAGGLAHMQGAAIGTAEHSGDPTLSRQALAQSALALGDAVLFEMAADDLDKLVGQDANEEVTLGALFGLVIDWTQAQF